jgi:hypothetical protein
LAPFDPFSLSRLTVIKIRHRFEGDHLLAKFFVVLGHRTDGFGKAYAICIKATSQTAGYKNNAERLRGCVYYCAGQVNCFPVDTVIQPDNQIPITHETIADAYFDNQLECWPMPADFEALLRAAVIGSATMSKRQKERILAVLDDPIC